MSKRGGRQKDRPAPSWEGERTMAEAEADAQGWEELPDLPDSATGPQQFGADPLEVAESAVRADARCPCGGKAFLLEAFLEVIDGRVQPRPLEVEALTCPECGREFEAVLLEDGRVVRGDFIGFAEADDDEEP